MEEKLAATAELRKMGQAVGLAKDSYYLADLPDDALGNLYGLLHSEFERVTITPARKDEITNFLMAEVSMRREFIGRGLDVPEAEDKLSESFDEVTVQKAEKGPQDISLDVETPQDDSDGHVHKIVKLDDSGTGATESAGNPEHSHNVDKFSVIPVEVEEYHSEHTGLVAINKHGNFKIINKNADGSCDFEADFEFYKVDVEKKLVGGVVYEPDVVDAQGDSSSEDEIEKACHNYMIKSQTLGLMHERKLEKSDSIVVENFIAKASYIDGNQLIRKGSWVLVSKVLNEQLWKDIKNGKYTGYSMAGRAKDISKLPPFGKRDSGGEDASSKRQMVGLASMLKSDFDFEKVIRRRGDKWCVMTQDGKKTLACHETREGAMKQLVAIETNKHLAPKHLAESWITKDDVAKLCPKCAVLMGKKGIKKIKIEDLLNSENFKKADAEWKPSQKLCDAFGDDPGFFTKCHEKMSTTNVETPEAFCAALHKFCVGYWPGSSKNKKPGKGK